MSHEHGAWKTWTPGTAPFWPYTRPTRMYWQRLDDGSTFCLRVVLYVRT